MKLNGLSGFMRVKNEELTLLASIESVINQVDELIIVYNNDCTDRTPDIIASAARKYPEKIKQFEYPYPVYGVYCDKKEYDFAKSLPYDSPNNLSSYCNFALEKTSYKYVIKLDADQIYFNNRIGELRELLLQSIESRSTRLSNLSIRLGKIIYNRWCHLDPICLDSKRKLIFRKLFLPYIRRPFLRYAITEMIQNGSYIALSGIDCINIHGTWMSPVSCIKNDGEIWEPYNGNGDLFIFKMAEGMRFIPKDYGIVHGKYCYLETFLCPDQKIIFCGFSWLHFKPQKSPFRENLTLQYDNNADCLLPICELAKLRFAFICRKSQLILWKRYVYGFATDMDRSFIRNAKKYLETFKISHVPPPTCDTWAILFFRFYQIMYGVCEENVLLER